MLIGWSEIDITPKKKIKLAGQFYERISEFTAQRRITRYSARVIWKASIRIFLRWPGRKLHRRAADVPRPDRIPQR